MKIEIQEQRFTFDLPKRDLVTLKFALSAYEQDMRKRAEVSEKDTRPQIRAYANLQLEEAECARRLRSKLPHWVIGR